MKISRRNFLKVAGAAGVASALAACGGASSSTAASSAAYGSASAVNGDVTIRFIEALGCPVRNSKLHSEFARTIYC